MCGVSCNTLLASGRKSAGQLPPEHPPITFKADVNHRVKNYDDHVFHLLSVVNATAPDSTKTDETAGDGELLSNPWFAEHRISLAPGATSEMLSFGNEVVLTQSREGLAHVIENGVIHSARSMPGAWSIHNAGSQFQIVNASAEALEFTLIEVRH